MTAERRNHGALGYRRQPDAGPARLLYLGSIDVPYRARDGSERLGKSCGWYSDMAAFRRDARALWRQGAGSVFTAAQPLRPGVLEAKAAAWAAAAEEDPTGYPAWATPRLNQLVIARRGNDLRDDDVEQYGVVFVDIDPVRERGAPAMPDQIEEARRVSLDVREFLEDLGAPAPIVARSGNGYHLLYRCDLEADELGAQIMRLAVRALARRFETPEVSIDESVANPGRKIRLHGLPNRKRDTAGHVIAEHATGVDELPEGFDVPTPRGVLEALALETLPRDVWRMPVRDALIAVRQRDAAVAAARPPVSPDLLTWRFGIALSALRSAGYRLRQRRDGSFEVEACPFMGRTHPSGPWKTRVAMDARKRSPVVTCLAQTCRPVVDAHVARGGCGFTLLRWRLFPQFAALEAMSPAPKGSEWPSLRSASKATELSSA